MQRGFFFLYLRTTKSLDDSWVFLPPQKLGPWSQGPRWPLLIPSTHPDPNPSVGFRELSPFPPNSLNSSIQTSTPDPESSPWPGAPNPTPDTTATGQAVLTPEEVLLTWCHCAEKAVRCHSCLWLQQAPLLFLCGFRDPWHVLNQEHAACHEEKKWKSHPQDMLLRINYLDDHK